VRAGEVAKAITVRSAELTELAEKLCAGLPGPYGALNVQVFVDSETGRLAVIELNARFGGGYPLSFAAGADFPLALVQEALGLPRTAALGGWQDGLVMLRYDAAVFVPEAAL
jgi:carbamoyl-phosphate synthase large subunit